MNEEALLQNILGAARNPIQDEVSSLLGHKLKLSEPRIRTVTKEDYFTETIGKRVLTRIAVDGDQSGEMYLLAPVQDVIRLGGTLVMLPPSELEARVRKGEFGEEENDAFGEIANIVTGIINSLFKENYPKKFHFVKTVLELLSTGQLDPAAAEPFPPQAFLLCSFTMQFGEQSLGNLDFLLPATLFLAAAPTPETPGDMLKTAPSPALSAAPAEDAATQPAPAATLSPSAPQAEAAAAQPAPAAAMSPAPPADEVAAQPATVTKMAPPAAESEPESASASASAPLPAPPLVLILAEPESDTEVLGRTLQERDFEPRCLDGQEDPKPLLGRADVRAIFLVMHEVSEQGFATAIRLRSLAGDRIPLIAVGPRWTRQTVLQAIKFGIHDILVAPASENEIHAMIEAHLQPEQSALLQA